MVSGKVYQSGDFVQFVAEARPEEVEYISENMQRLMGERPLEMDVYGAVFYWLVLHNQRLPFEKRIDLNPLLVGLGLVYPVVLDEAWEEKLDFFAKGLVKGVILLKQDRPDEQREVGS